MARHAREKSEFGTYHITQHGGSCRKLFEKNDDRDRLVEIVEKAKDKFGFTLHGFCFVDDNNYDLIIEVNGSDISKIMKSINIAYAMYTKCEGKLYHDRYKSHLLEDSQSLEQLKAAIRSHRANPDSKTCYNLCFDEIQPIVLNTLSFEDCSNCITDYDMAEQKLAHIAKDKGMSVETMLHNKDIRNELICMFRKSSTLSLKSLGKLFGGLSESTVSKILN